MAGESKFAHMDRGQLQILLREYCAGNERGHYTWKIEEIEAELHRRALDTTIAIDEKFRLVVRTPENRVGRVYAIQWEAGKCGAD